MKLCHRPLRAKVQSQPQNSRWVQLAFWCAEEHKATNAFVRMTHNMASQEAAASLNLSLLVRIIWNNYSGCIWIGLPLSELLK